MLHCTILLTQPEREDKQDKWRVGQKDWRTHEVEGKDRGEEFDNETGPLRAESSKYLQLRETGMMKSGMIDLLLLLLLHIASFE